MRHITNVISTIFGHFAKIRFPYIIQIQINKIYTKIFDIDFSEFSDINSYKSLNELFTRKLIIKRKIPTSEKDIISPCDSLITQAGKINNLTAMQVKGREYSIRNFLTRNSAFYEKFSSRFEGGDYINFYLSPRDYHCYHAPCDLKITKSIHISGKLFPVNLKFLHKKDELFCNNERVILECFSTKGQIIYIVFVGALNVGQMKFKFDDRLSTNIVNSQSIFHYDDIELKKGDFIGNFEMGSTIVLITQKGFLSPTIKTNDSVKFADVIAKRL